MCGNWHWYLSELGVHLPRPGSSGTGKKKGSHSNSVVSRKEEKEMRGPGPAAAAYAGQVISALIGSWAAVRCTAVLSS